MKLGMVDYVRDTTPHDNFGGGSTTLGKYVTFKSLSFFSFFPSFFCFLRHSPSLHFFTDRDDLCVKTRVSGQGCAFWGLDNIRLHLGVKLPKKFPQMSGNRHFAAMQNRKIAIYRSPMKIFASNFTDRLSTKGTIEKMQNYIKWGRESVT